MSVDIENRDVATFSKRQQVQTSMSESGNPRSSVGNPARPGRGHPEALRSKNPVGIVNITSFPTHPHARAYTTRLARVSVSIFSMSAFLKSRPRLAPTRLHYLTETGASRIMVLVITIYHIEFKAAEGMTTY